MSRNLTLGALASLGALAICGAYGCGDETSELTSSSGDPGPSGTGGGTTGTNTGGQVSVGTNVGGGEGGSGGSCADVVVEASVEKKPADIIFMIDNSGSMTDEILSVEQNINVNFASIIQSSGVDYQVIMVTDHGDGSSFSNDVCVGPPLSGTTNCAAAPVNIPGQFYHYDIHVESWDSVCRMFGSMFGDEPDQWSQAPNGWNSWLRPEAVKVFVEITDDQMGCDHQSVSMYGNGDINQGQQAALAFDGLLLGMNPGQFGTTADRNYIFYSIIGLPSKSNPQDPYNEFEPVVTGTCNSAWSPATAYQWLSKGTGGLRFPVCNTQSYDVVFQDIAAGVIDVTSVPCAFDVPDPPPGEMLDLETVDVLYTPGGGGSTQTWVKVDSAAQCGPGKFYVDETVTPNKIHLCPEACAVVEGDGDATIEVKIECGFIPE